MKLEFHRQIFEKYINIQNFMKIRPVGAVLFHVDGRMDGRTDRQTHKHTHTDMTKLIVAFRNVANASRNQTLSDV
jgi:hypothetical protein